MAHHSNKTHIPPLSSHWNSSITTNQDGFSSEQKNENWPDKDGFSSDKDVHFLSSVVAAA
jgi:hypothetical protein